MRACFFPGVHLACDFRPPIYTLVLGAGIVRHNLGQRELPHAQSFSPFLPAVSFAEPKAPFQYPGAAKLPGQSQGLLFSSMELPLHGLQECSALWKKKSKYCSFGEGTSQRSASSLTPTQKEDANAHLPVLPASPVQAGGPVSSPPVPCQQLGPSLSLQHPATFLKLHVFTPAKLLPAKYLNSSFSKHQEINMRHVQCCGDISLSTSR